MYCSNMSRAKQFVCCGVLDYVRFHMFCGFLIAYMGGPQGSRGSGRGLLPSCALAHAAGPWIPLSVLLCSLVGSGCQYWRVRQDSCGSGLGAHAKLRMGRGMCARGAGQIDMPMGNAQGGFLPYRCRIPVCHGLRELAMSTRGTRFSAIPESSADGGFINGVAASCNK